MKIIPNRTMRLGGEHLERGKAVEVSDNDGEKAIRHGWATEAKGKAKAAPEGKAEQKEGAE